EPASALSEPMRPDLGYRRPSPRSGGPLPTSDTAAPHPGAGGPPTVLAPEWGVPLLYVLHLLPQLLAERLRLEHGADHLGVAALGAQGVELAEDLLGQEIEPLAGRPGGRRDRREVRQVRAQAVDLLA